MLRLSLVIPAYQEAARIEAHLEQIIGYLAPRGAFEVIVVDDGSRDGTADAVRRAAARHPQVKLLAQAENRGKGAAVRAGVEQAQGESICFLDADLAIPIETVERGLAALEGGADVVIASRALPGSRGAATQSWRRRLLSGAFNQLVRRSFGLRFGDTQCGFKGFRRDAARAIFSSARIDGFAFDVEVLVIARQHGYRVAEIPVQLAGAGPSTVNVGTHAPAIWRELRQIRAGLRRGLYAGASRGPAPSAGSPAIRRERLTAVLLTKNEERQIARCLESIRWVDEIIVVDGLSADRTQEICRSYGARVIPHAFSGDFGLERNIGADAATGEWILSLDADDVVSDELRRAIERMLASGSPHAAYSLRRKNNFLGRWMMHGGWYHMYPVLYRNALTRFEGRVHHVPKFKGTLGVIDAPVLHYPFTSLEQFIMRHNRYTSIEAQEMRETLGILDARTVRYQLTWRPLKLFWKSYVKKQGYREGWHGLVFAILFAWVHFIKWAKYWELVRDAYEPQQGAPHG